MQDVKWKELRRAAERKLNLEELLVALNREKQELEQEMLSLKVAAHNEQADVDNLEAFSVKGLLLSLTGRKEERLEQERQEARAAKSKFDTAQSRLQSVSAQINSGNVELKVLAGADAAYWQFLCEGCPAAASDLQIRELSQKQIYLESTLSAAEEANAKIDMLTKKIGNIQKWSGVRSAVGNTPGVASADDGLRGAERGAQQVLNDLLELLNQVQQELALDLENFRGIGDAYLEDLLTDAIITARTEKVLIAIRSAAWQLDAGIRKLNGKIAENRIKLQKAVLDY